MEKPDQLDASEQRFHSLFDNNPDLILFQNADGIILDANPAFLALVGQSRVEVLQRPYAEFLPPDIRPLYQEKLAEAFTGNTVHFDMYAVHGSSAPRYWDVVKVPVMTQGRVLGVHMIARDISDKVKVQKDLYRQNIDLQQVAYLVSHNLRAPLANALGLVDLLGPDEAGSSVFEATRHHLQTSLHQLDLVLQDMNAILTAQDRSEVAEPAWVPLAEVVEQAVEHLQSWLDQCGGLVKIELSPALRVRGNRAYLYSIFFNLLSNSLKYRSDRRPLLVHITGNTGPGQDLRIEFSDNGVGFDRDQAGVDVFSLYKRFHSHYPGRGVGLYLIRTHVQGMGGRIEVSSQPDQGTRFLIQFPPIPHADFAR